MEGGAAAPAIVEEGALRGLEEEVGMRGRQKQGVVQGGLRGHRGGQQAPIERTSKLIYCLYRLQRNFHHRFLIR